jgi:peptide/nickel transport system substrate-binding protein
MLSPRLLWIDRTEVGLYNNHVAESWEEKVDEDGDVYIEFKFKPGLTFRDGTPIDAENMKWNWERALYDLPTRTQNAESYAVYGMNHAWGQTEKKLVVEDQYTLRMYTDPNWPHFDPFWKHFMFGLDYSFMFSKTMGEQYGKETSSLADYAEIGEMGGWGPFYLESWVPNERYTLVRNEDYPVNPLGPDAGPSYSEHIKRIVVISYQDPASLRLALESHEIDVTWAGQLSRADVPSLMENPDIHMELIPGMGSGNQLHMNYAPEFAPLNDVKVRKAIQYAVDPQEIVDKLMFGTAEVSHSPVRPSLEFYKPIMEPIRDLPMDERIQIAKDLLAEAGYADGFTTQFWYISGTGSEAFNRDLGTVLQEQLAKIDITLELKYTESGLYFEMVRAGQLPMFTRGWTYDYPDPDTELFYLMYSTSPDLAMRINFNDPHVDDLLTEGRQIYNQGQEERREEIYTELQDYIVENGFDVPLYLDGFWYGYGSYIENYKPWVTHDKPNHGLWNIEKVIPDDWETYDPPN